jgi:hypothetical protein
MFTGLFFMSIVPAGLMFSCLAMFVCYWVDKYLLLRKWRQIPRIGGDLAKDSQTYLLIAVVCHFMVTTVFYSNFTYDHACAINVDCMAAGGYAAANVEDCYLRDHPNLFAAYKETDLYKAHGDSALQYAKTALKDEVSDGVYAASALGQAEFDLFLNTTKAGGSIDLLVANLYSAPTQNRTWHDSSLGNSMDNHTWKYTPPGGETVNAAWVWCDKRASDEIREYIYGDTPGWMSEQQNNIKEVYRSITAFGVLVILAVSLLSKLYNLIMKLTVGSYTPTGETQGIEFTSCEDIQAYVPQWRQAGFPQPFTACDMVAGTINPDYLSFETYDYDLQALCIDAKVGEDAHYPDIVGLNKERSRMGKPIFSPIKMYINEILASGVKSSDLESSATGEVPIDLRDIEAQLEQNQAAAF